jgi:hypothetical protein
MIKTVFFLYMLEQIFFDKCVKLLSFCSGVAIAQVCDGEVHCGCEAIVVLTRWAYHWEGWGQAGDLRTSSEGRTWNFVLQKVWNQFTLMDFDGQRMMTKNFSISSGCPCVMGILRCSVFKGSAGREPGRQRENTCWEGEKKRSHSSQKI